MRASNFVIGFASFYLRHLQQCVRLGGILTRIRKLVQPLKVKKVRGCAANKYAGFRGYACVEHRGTFWISHRCAHISRAKVR